MNDAPSSRIIRFGVFEVDLQSGEFRKSGVKLKLQEQPFQVLICLLERPGKVVSREKLIEKLWPHGTVVDYEHSLGTAINKIRQALGDSADNPRFVETVPRRGYRFLVPVEGIPSPSDEPASQAPAWPPRPGGRISHYQIVDKIGEGGMGVVYKAEDTKLLRSVALKFLSPNLLGEEEVKARFIREAQAAASLNHSNICTVHEIDEFEGRTFIAMAFLEGAGLDQKIEAGPLKLSDVLDIATQTTQGLQAAHEKGIVHRDIKPSNLMISGSLSKQQVTIMDFGLAQLADRSKLTRKDETMGTVGYMSPEQTYGMELDLRTDIWALGVVIYEMVTGQQPFKGHYDKAVMYSITNEPPEPITGLRTGVPMELELLVGKCLAKDREQRYQHTDELIVDLQSLSEKPKSGRSKVLDPQTQQREIETTTPPVTAGTASMAGAGSVTGSGMQDSEGDRPQDRRLRISTAVVSGVAIAIATAGLTWWLSHSSTPGSPSAGPQDTLTQLTRDPGISYQPVISPDGDLVAYASDRAGDDNLDIYVQQIGGGGVIRLTDHSAHDREPEFSPDGKTIAFASNRDGGGIYLAPALGGDARLLVRGSLSKPRFSPDGRWVHYWAYGRGGTNRIVPAAGGQPRELARAENLDSGSLWGWAFRDRLLWGVSGGGTSQARELHTAPLEGGEAVKTGVVEVLNGAGVTLDYRVREVRFQDFRWSDHRSALILSGTQGDGNNLWAVPMSPETGKVTGPPERLTVGPGWDLHPSSSNTGRLVFANVNVKTDLWSVPVDANQGRVTGEIERLTNDAAMDRLPFLSADGKKVVFISNRAGNYDVWVKDLGTGKDTQVTVTPEDEHFGVINADGTQAAYDVRDGQKSTGFVVSTLGGPPRKVCEDCGLFMSWSRDGKKIARNSRSGVQVLDVASGESFVLAPNTKYTAFEPRFSADGRWVAFHSVVKPGTRRIMVVPVRGEESVPADDWIPITDGVTNDMKPYWSPDGNLMYYVSESAEHYCIWARRLDPATKQPVGEPFEVYHVRGAQRSLGAIPITTMSVAGNRMVFNLTEITGNVWMMEPQESQ